MFLLYSFVVFLYITVFKNGGLLKVFARLIYIDCCVTMYFYTFKTVQRVYDNALQQQAYYTYYSATSWEGGKEALAPLPHLSHSVHVSSTCLN